MPWRGGRHGYSKSAADGRFLFLLDNGCCGRLAAAGLRTGATDTLSFVLLCLALDFDWHLHSSLHFDALKAKQCFGWRKISVTGIFVRF